MQLKIYRAKEDELIKGCLRREHHAQKLLYDTYSSKMYGLCYRYIKDSMQAEDVLVTSFTKVFEKIEQFKHEGSFEGWIRRIVVNEALTYLRRNRSVYLETELEQADVEPNYKNLSDHLEAEDLLRIVSELPTGYRIVFNMYAIDGYSHKEIAEYLGISENTSKSQLSRARAHLQKVLKDQEWTPNKNLAMMNQQPDNFFREKLENYQKPAPVGAWNRIELSLKKNKNIFGWWKIAATASLLLLGTVGYLLWHNTVENSNRPMAQTTTESQPSSPEIKNNKTQQAQDFPNQELKDDKASLPDVPLINKETSGKKDKSQKINIARDPEKKITVPIDSQESGNEAINKVIPSSIPTVAQADHKSEPVSKVQKITLKFSVDETNEYLDKNTFAQATSDGKKSSTFKKLLKKANDLKSNQDPFGDLREKKNEILALNFKNEKRGQNK